MTLEISSKKMKSWLDVAFTFRVVLHIWTWIFNLELTNEQIVFRKHIFKSSVSLLQDRFLFPNLFIDKVWFPAMTVACKRSNKMCSITQDDFLELATKQKVHFAKWQRISEICQNERPTILQYQAIGCMRYRSERYAWRKYFSKKII